MAFMITYDLFETLEILRVIKFGTLKLVYYENLPRALSNSGF